MVEVAVASVVVAVLLVSSLQLLTATIRSSTNTSLRTTGMQLANSLMEEIQAVPFGSTDSPAENPHRSSFRTLADYAAWSSTPPVDRDGSAIASTAWQREVEIRGKSLANASVVANDADNADCAQVTVTVKYHNQVVSQLTALRCESWSVARELDDSDDRHLDKTNHEPRIIIDEAGPLTGSSPLNVTFDASSTLDPDGDTLTFEWNFGNGTQGYGPVVAHQFLGSSSGRSKITATLTVSDAHGATATEAFDIYLDYD
jgi:Tfp pilus assembly protein PilV